MKNFESVAAYIAEQPESLHATLEALRECIQQAAPEATETIAYGMPAYRFEGPLVYFGVFKKHIGFYPMPSALAFFEADLSPYKSSKGSVQFPLTQPLPLDLIQKIIAFRVQENAFKAALRPPSKRKK